MGWVVSSKDHERLCLAPGALQLAMSHLPSLPAEVRNRIYDFHLDGLELELGTKFDIGIFASIIRPGWSHAISLALVNRQLHDELGDIRGSCKGLIVYGRTHNRKKLERVVPRIVLQQIQFSHTKIDAT